MSKRGRHGDEERGGKRRFQPAAGQAAGRGANTLYNNPLYQCQQQNAALQATIQGLHRTIQQLEEQLRTVEVTIRQQERVRCDQTLQQRIAAEMRNILNQPQGQQHMEFRRLHNRLLTR